MRVAGCRDGDDPAEPNVWLSKYDRFGDLLWTHQRDINPEVTECGIAVAVVDDDPVVLLSSDYGASGNSVWVRRLGPGGALMSTFSAPVSGRSGETYSELVLTDDGG